MNRKLRMGMVGGGRGAFIGKVHRMAAQLGGKVELVCGAFSSDPEKSRASGADLFLPEDRVYPSFQEMMTKEAALPADIKMDFVTIVTPNNVHYPAAVAALEAGFHVACDKPMTISLDEARRLERKVEETGLVFCLTHNYTGYPMVKEARELFRTGALGKIRKVSVEYAQGGAAARAYFSPGQKPTSWRSDPARAGSAQTMADIGTHAENLMEYVTGLKIESLCADLTSFASDGRDDDGNVLLRFKDGARGVLWASGVALGEENDLAIRAYGSKGAIEWHQVEPNTLIVRWIDKPREIRRTGTGFAGKSASANTWLPQGHPEGFIEAFANIYRNFTAAVTDFIEGRKAEEHDFPTVHDGVRGMAFLEAVLKSSGATDKWINIE